MGYTSEVWGFPLWIYSHNVLFVLLFWVNLTQYEGATFSGSTLSFLCFYLGLSSPYIVRYMYTHTTPDKF